MNKEEALEKIKKLLQPQGRTEAEWDTAQILAAAIAEKNGINLAEVDREEQRRTCAIVHKTVGTWVKCPIEADCAAVICKNFFEVSCFTQRDWLEERLIFVGLETHIKIAEYVCHFLSGEFRQAWNKKRGRCRNRKQFIYGAMVALYQKLKERFKPAGQQLTLELEVSFEARRKQYIAENFGKMESKPLNTSKRSGAAIQQGYRAGRAIEIRPGVNGNDPARATELGSGRQTKLLTA